jgi:hypothetical protein
MRWYRYIDRAPSMDRRQDKRIFDKSSLPRVLATSKIKVLLLGKEHPVDSKSAW